MTRTKQPARMKKIILKITVLLRTEHPFLPFKPPFLSPSYFSLTNLAELPHATERPIQKACNIERKTATEIAQCASYTSHKGGTNQ